MSERSYWEKCIMPDEDAFWADYGDPSHLPISRENLIAYALRHDAQPIPDGYLWAFLGDSRPSADYKLYMRDHVDVWLRCGASYSFTIQPYGDALNLPRALKEWADFAKNNGLRYRILPAGSGWYNPQRTVCVEFTFDYEKRWDLPFFYDEVVEIREHPERYEHSC